MRVQLSKRSLKPDFQGDFTRSILAVGASPDIISFAGGLPNPVSFPVKEMETAVQKVLENHGVQALQYATAAGYDPLREWIAKRYAKTLGITDVKPEEIIITNGSQQALDMMTSVLIDPGDGVVVEDPTYLAALQSFHLYDPTVYPVELREDGINYQQLEKTLDEHPVNLMYVIPNFQNPTGLTYSREVREKVAEILRKHDGLVLLEDNPYTELRYSGTPEKSFSTYIGEQCCMLGTFSKIVSPGMRVGWICVRNEELRNALLNYKVTEDLHTNIFCQMILAQYLTDNDIDEHLVSTIQLYAQKSGLMQECMEKYLPEGVTFTKPQGGMFLWVTMPEGVKALDVYYAALDKGVAVCPGDPFYESQRNVRTMRINYSNSSDENIEKGIKILGEAIRQCMKNK
jgi:2-aminoadipate transaminase